MGCVGCSLEFLLKKNLQKIGYKEQFISSLFHIVRTAIMIRFQALYFRFFQVRENEEV